MPGRRALAVFDPGGVADIVASAGRPNAASVEKESVPGALLPPSELSFKLYSQRRRLSVIQDSAAHIFPHGKGKKIGPHGSSVYRRVDLEKI